MGRAVGSCCTPALCSTTQPRSGARRECGLDLLDEFVDCAALDGLGVAEALGESAALLLAATFEGDDIASGDATIPTDAVGWDMPGVEQLVQVSTAHPQLFSHLGGCVIGVDVEQGDGAAGRERVGQGEEKITQCALAEVAGEPGE